MVAGHLLTLAGAAVDGLKAGVRVLELGVGNALEERVLVEVLLHPNVQVLDVGDGVEDAALLKRVCVEVQERGVDNAETVLRALEVRVGEKEEHLVELALVEVVGAELHDVGTNARDVVELGDLALAKLVRGVLGARNLDRMVDNVSDAVADLDSHDQLVGVEGSEGVEQTAETAADVGESDLLGALIGDPAGESGRPVVGIRGSGREDVARRERVGVGANALLAAAHRKRNRA